MGWKITFWEPTLSPHKVGLVQALARHPGIVKVEMVAHSAITSSRKEQGWSEPDASEGFFVGLSASQIEERIALSSEDAVHIISGMRGRGTLEVALQSAIRHRKQFGLMSEPRASEGITGITRYLHSIMTEGRLRKNARFVLAIGAHGPTWFRRTGYNANSIFPCGYFLPEMSHGVVERTGKVVVSYLGRLEKEKGIDLFLKAIPSFCENTSVRVAGHGTWAARIREASSENLIYNGVIPASNVSAFLDETDILVVPSRSTNDGWAAVVSEALMRGVALVVSDKVGASVLLQEQWLGEVVPSEDSSAIAKAVNTLVGSPVRLRECRQLRSKWANESLTATAGADYIVNVMNHVFLNKEKPAPFYIK